MRSTLYWLTSTALAVICMKVAATTQADGGVLATTDPMFPVPQTDPMRAILHGVGIMAMAYTYHRVWANFSVREKGPDRPNHGHLEPCTLNQGTWESPMTRR